MRLDDFNFSLPKDLIATHPLPQRTASRLLCVDGPTGTLVHRHFYEMLDLVEPGDLLVFNDTKVIPARLFGHKTTGGQAEVLVERVIDHQHILAQVRVSKALRMGDHLIFSESIQLEVIEKNGSFYLLRYHHDDRAILDVIEEIGHIPLPPYMQRQATASDRERYQTVYARHKGSVAAPTAGLHFDETLLNQLRAKKVDMGFLTLHIGAGTFTPVRVDNIDEHQMHAEYIDVSQALCEKIARAKAQGKRVIAVGTTCMRALETATQSGVTEPYAGETSIFIYPGYQFRCVDALITNLHLPCSSLLMLVCAFGGHSQVICAYREAVLQQYRFYSYGDAMWVSKR